MFDQDMTSAYEQLRGFENTKFNRFTPLNFVFS